ncbi:MAG: hypothetical protein VW800_13715, partial [Acidimicrobiaceae bacterium]
MFPPASGLAGPPPTSPNLSGEHASIPGSSGGRWRVAAGVLGGLALSVLLVGGGYLIGEQQAEQAPVIQERAVTPATNASADTNTAPATTTPPIVDLEQAAIEPATAVARAVTPSVVRISTGFGQGSGIIWDAANGYIVTNDHVTDTADTVSVLLHNGVEVSGVV